MTTETTVEFESTGKLTFSHPEDTFALTPASRALMNAVVKHSGLISGTGIDWGSGVGSQAILAATFPQVKKVYGLELSGKNVTTAGENARANGMENKTAFFVADSYVPFDQAEREILENEKGTMDFILSNPPASRDGDGLGFRRRVLSEGREYLKPGGYVFLNISFQYGKARIRGLCEDMKPYEHLGVIHSSGNEPFDLERKDLLSCIRFYVGHEKETGLEYEFLLPGSGDRTFSAGEAYEHYLRTGSSPITRWETHLFRLVT